MGLIETFGVNADKQKNGVWVEYGESRVLVAFAGDGNPNYEKFLERYMRPIRKEIAPNRNMSDSTKAKLHEAFISTYAKSVILDWENVKENGIEIPFSTSECIRFFKMLTPWFAEIREFASDIANFQDESDEEDEKN